MDSFLADNTYFIKSLKLVDSVSFIGFPKGVFDTDRNLPIARNANIASAPSLPFKNDAVEGEIVLVSGLSFGGGSPVISIPVGNKGIGVGRVLESKLVGIMAGHLVDKDDKHKGLSYFTKSPKIIDTLKENNLNDYSILVTSSIDSVLDECRKLEIPVISKSIQSTIDIHTIN